MRGVVVAASMAALCLPLAASAAEIRIGGTGNALGTMRLLGEAYAQWHADTKITILSSIGSSGAIRAVPKGALDIGLIARPLTREEAGTGLKAIEYARSPTVFAVQEKNKATTISFNQIADIYSGRLPSWPDGTPIRPVLRQPGDDNTRQIRLLSPAIEKASIEAEQRPGLIFAVTDQEAADKMESVPGSIGVTTQALIKSEKRSLKALSISGIEPTLENTVSGHYPMTKHFYFVLPKDPSATVLDFVNFVNSAQGRELLKRYGHTLPERP